MKETISNLTKNESGQTALALVLILVILGTLILGPLLAYMNTGLKAGQMHEDKTQRYYAADAGIEDAMWQIKNAQLSNLFYDYDRYDYDTPYPYTLADNVSGKNVDITIENVWIPKGISVPDPDTARATIEDPKLIVTGALTGTSEYQIKLSYYYEAVGDSNGENLKVETIGIWLPPGFNYEGNCSLADDPDTQPYSSPDVEGYRGGKAVLWDFAPLHLKDFPGGTGYPMERSFTFEFSPGGENPGAALSWIDTTEVAAIDYTWDADVKIYKISSAATDPTTGKQTTVETYSSKVEMRKLGSATWGDYHAIGGTLMTTTSDPYYRDRLFKESGATVAEGDIPSTATIEAGWLYWSGWIEGSGHTIWQDDCSNFADWANPGSDWRVSSGRFQGHHRGTESHRYLAMASSLDLSGASPGSAELKWTQSEGGRLESDDCLRFQFSDNGGGSWDPLITAFCNDSPPSSFSYDIPDEYLTTDFKMRFYLDGFGDSSPFSGTEYCYVDDITVSVTETSVQSEKVNRVIFNGDQITTNQWQVAPTPDAGGQWGSTGGENSWSYSCFYDATEIVRAELDPDTRSGTFTLEHVLEGNSYTLYPSGTTDYPLATPAQEEGWSGYPTQHQWTYAGWSLLIIYSSPETKGHQLYLFDNFHYVGLNTLVEFPITGFLAPDDTTGSHLTYFVGEGDDHYVGDFIEVNGNPLSDPPGNPWNNAFNSYSNTIDDPILKSGIDIDTFDISEFVDPGDTAAEVILDNGEEIYDLVYIIISFRSDIITGGSISYVIK